MRDNVSFSLVNFLIIFRHWAGLFRPPHFFSAWLSNFHSPPPLEHFEHKKFLGKKKVPFVFRHGGKRFQHCVKNIPGEVVKATIYKFTGKSGGQITLLKAFFSVTLFGPWSEVFRFLCEKYQSAYQYCILRVTRRNWKRRKWTLKEKVSNLEEKLPPVGQNFNSYVHENSLNGKYFWNNFTFYTFSYSKRKKVRLLSK